MRRAELYAEHQSCLGENTRELPRCDAKDPGDLFLENKVDARVRNRFLHAGRLSRQVPLYDPISVDPESDGGLDLVHSRYNGIPVTCPKSDVVHLHPHHLLG